MPKNLAEVHEAMRLVLKSNPDLLQAYRSDFEMDMQKLDRLYGEGMRFLWVPRRYGSDLFQLGVSQSAGDGAFALARLEMMDREPEPWAVHLVTDKGIRPITRVEAKSQVAKLDYSLESALVRHQGRALAGYTLSSNVRAGRLYGQVAYTGNVSAKNQMAALLELARIMVTKLAGTFFCTVERVTLNGKDVPDLMEAV